MDRKTTSISLNNINVGRLVNNNNNKFFICQYVIFVLTKNVNSLYVIDKKKEVKIQFKRDTSLTPCLNIRENINLVYFLVRPE